MKELLDADKFNLAINGFQLASIACDVGDEDNV